MRLLHCSSYCLPNGDPGKDVDFQINAGIVSLLALLPSI